MISHDPKIPFLIQSLDIALYRTFGESAMYSRDQQSVQLACAILEACRDCSRDYPGTNRLSRPVSRPPPRQGRERLETSCGKAREVNHVQGVIAQCTTMQHPLKILKSLSQLRNWQTAPKYTKVSERL